MSDIRILTPAAKTTTTPAPATVSARRFGFVIISEAKAKALAAEELRIQELHKKAISLLEKLADECQLPEEYKSLRCYDLGEGTFTQVSKELIELLKQDSEDIYLRALGIENYLNTVYLAYTTMQDIENREGYWYPYELLTPEEEKVVDEVPAAWEPHLVRAIFCIALWAEHQNLQKMVEDHRKEIGAAERKSFNKEVL